MSADDAEVTDAADSAGQDPRVDAADGQDLVSADSTVADPTPADVAVEEPIVEEPAVQETSVGESALGEPALEEPLAADPVAEQAVAEESVAEEPSLANGADTAGPALDDDGVPSERAADAASDGSDDRTLVLDVPDVPAGPTGDDEDPTPPDVRVEELTGDSSPAGDHDGRGEDPASSDVPVDELTDDRAPVEDHDGLVVAAPEEPVLEDPASSDARIEELTGDGAPAAGDDDAADLPVSGEPVSEEPASDEPASLDDLTDEDAPAADHDDTVGPSAPEASTIEAAASVSAASDDETDEVAPAAEVAATVEQRSADDDAAAVPVLSLRNVSKSFGELRAVDAIDLTVPAGSFYGLVGPNGAGKTTTLSIIAGLLRADSGSVTINGVDATKRSREAKKLIGVLPDRLRTFDRLTGRQLLSYYGALRGLPAPLVESRTADLARAFDLVDALARPVSDYSAGMTKKVMLAGAMIHSPRLLVLDEPFEAVDPVSSGVILDILGSYVDHGGTVILSSHGMELVERVCSRVAVIVSGQVLAEGTVDEVRGEATLEQRFLELAGGLGDVEGLEWLHTFSA
ncbi:ATP-binding cassette domain-containing protein [Microbacterium hydrothermale]|uniref:ATP-binding cassette domain-containing protein n=1 Tax=Microbacterium hydrothermale TaxID=857427 RepID=UPI002227E9B8|nr:ATP-binding cassette domain-containing protein [Microbacterium hydrothermale]